MGLNRAIEYFLVDRVFQGIILGLVGGSVLGAFLRLQGPAYLGFVALGCMAGIMWATGFLNTIISEAADTF